MPLSWVVALWKNMDGNLKKNVEAKALKFEKYIGSDE